MFWGGGVSREMHSGSQSRLHLPKYRRVLRPHPSAITVVWGSKAEHGNWGGWVARKNFSGKALSTVNFFFC